MKIDRRKLLHLSGASVGALMFGSCARGQSNDSDWPGPATPATEIPKLPVGMNLGGIADYGPGFPFRNLMWGARPWMTHNADLKGPWDTKKQSELKLDQDGYPTEIPFMVPGLDAPQGVFTVLPNQQKPGKYVLLHDGDGTFVGVMGTRVISAKRGRVLLEMTHKPPSVEGIFITRSNPADHVRNIRIVPLADEHVDLDADPFLPEFLDFCRPFHALRFMDWGATNNSMEEKWSQRRLPSFYTMVGKTGDPDGSFSPRPTAFEMRFAGGVAHEVMIKLANKLKIDPWFCIPHRADDEYIRNFSRLVREQLDPQLKVYVEFSNEMWNWSFLQSGWMLQSRLAGDLVEAKGGKAWDNPEKTKGGYHPERIGALFGRAFRLWQEAWQGDARKRMIRVCATQTAWLEVAMRTLNTCMAHGGADAVAQTSYFGATEAQYTKWAARGAALTADEVIADMHDVLNSQARGGAPLVLAQHARDLGLKYLVYEGGQHLIPKMQGQQLYNSALGAAQVHPGMYDLYLETLRTARHLGCSLFCAYSSISPQGVRFGSWGVKESYEQKAEDAPKYRALMAANT